MAKFLVLVQSKSCSPSGGGYRCQPIPKLTARTVAGVRVRPATPPPQAATKTPMNLRRSRKTVYNPALHDPACHRSAAASRTTRARRRTTISSVLSEDVM